jgi:hypothetical protein
VDAVGLIQLGSSADTLEQKRNEMRLVLLGELGVDALEPLLVLLAHVRRHSHAGDDDLRLRISRFCPVDDGLQIRAGGVGHDPAQSVIAAEFDHQHIDALPQEPVEPPQAARGGIAAHTGVDHAKLHPALVCLLLEQGRKAFLGVDAVARSQAVAEDDDRSRRAVGRRACGCGVGRRRAGEQPEKRHCDESAPDRPCALHWRHCSTICEWMQPNLRLTRLLRRGKTLRPRIGN